MWAGLPALVGLTLLGLLVGPAAAPEHLRDLVVNRVLVCVAMTVVAVLVHARFRADARE